MSKAGLLPGASKRHPEAQGMGRGGPREVKQALGKEYNRRRAWISVAWLTPRGRRI